MPTPLSATLEALTPAGYGLRATFFWRVDRYAHRIERIEAGVALPLIESLEGSDLDRWPPSPPLQQLHIENLPDGRPAALLVGMAGANHWSLSVEPEPGAAALLFDAACRVKEDGGKFGSGYRSFVRQEWSGASLLLHRAGGQGQPAVIEVLPSTREATPAPELRIEGSDSFALAIGAENQAGRTLRWKYRVRVP